MALPRKHFKCEKLDEPAIVVDEHGEAGYGNKPIEQAKEPEANLISSELDYPDEEVDPEDRLHAPALDIDLPVECYESSTPGHFHVFIDRPMTWRQYKKLLKALSKAGIIEEGYYKASVKRGATYLRKKGVKKQQPQQDNGNQAGGYIENPPALWANWH